MLIKKTVKRLIRLLNRGFKKLDWYNLRSTEPISRVFGFDRGLPIDRYYIEKFLFENRHLIKGDVLEIAENRYSKKYGIDVKNYGVLDVSKDNSVATVIGDLTNPKTLPNGTIDCFICTQTLNYIYNFKEAIKGSKYLLKEGGIILTTVAGISQISRYDMDRWGDYWRFTTLSIYKSFSEVFGSRNVRTDFYGNVLSTIAHLEGISSNELTEIELDYKDEDYQLLITVIAQKKQ